MKSSSHLEDDLEVRDVDHHARLLVNVAREGELNLVIVAVKVVALAKRLLILGLTPVDQQGSYMASVHQSMFSQGWSRFNLKRLNLAQDTLNRLSVIKLAQMR